jgi:hypothetical protein
MANGFQVLLGQALRKLEMAWDLCNVKLSLVLEWLKDNIKDFVLYREGHWTRILCVLIYLLCDPRQVT